MKKFKLKRKIMMMAVALLCATTTQAYTITVAEQQNCTVKVSPQKQSYNEGETITVTLTPADGAEYDYFEVYYDCTEAEWWAAQSAHAPRHPSAPRRASSFGERHRLELWHLDGHRNEPCEVARGATYTFTMPARNVELEAFFTGNSSTVQNTITVEQTANGTTRVDKTKASAGTIVNITATPVSDHSVDKVHVFEKETFGGAIYETLIDVTKIDQNHYSFTMPANPVRVKVTYQQGFTLILKDDADNTAAIEAAMNSGYSTHNVVLEGRTLYKDGSWNTLCLPFALGNAEADDNHHFDGTPLEGATVKTLAISEFKNGTIILNFSDDLSTIEAGKPCIVKWSRGCNVKNPVFSGVTLSTSEALSVSSYAVTFQGTFSPVVLHSQDKTKIYFDTGSTLSHPETDTSINAFRAYFQLDPSLGDVNGDGTVSVTDVTLLVNRILGLPDDGLVIKNADLNGDGMISVADVTLLVNVILNISNQFSVVVKGAEGITF